MGMTLIWASQILGRELTDKEVLSTLLLLGAAAGALHAFVSPRFARVRLAQPGEVLDFPLSQHVGAESNSR